WYRRESALFNWRLPNLNIGKEGLSMRPVSIGFGLVSAMLVACSAPAPPVTPAAAARPTVATAPQTAPTPTPAVAQAAAPAVAPATAPSAAAQTGANAGPPSVVKVPVNSTGTYDPATTLIMYGDIVLFAGGENPENCTPKSRFKRGDPVGFRATAIDPTTGKVAEAATLTVKLASG